MASNGPTSLTIPSGFYLPIFSTREISTEVTVFDGATVVMGGLTRDEVRTVNDRVPILGDIPGIGRLFRSEGETRQKRNLLIFVHITVSFNLTYINLPENECCHTDLSRRICLYPFVGGDSLLKVLKQKAFKKYKLFQAVFIFHSSSRFFRPCISKFRTCSLFMRTCCLLFWRRAARWPGPSTRICRATTPCSRK